jgi:lipopolysaccharide biosynthesis protein
MDGEVLSGSRSQLCIFTHYDRDGLIDDYVVHYLKALADLGCEIAFVSTAPGLDADGVARIRPLTSKILLRENRGHDFASWRDGLAACGNLSHYQRLIIANDSVYGPVHDLGKVFTAMQMRGAPSWGITDSFRYGRHLQSYFLVFERAVLVNAAFLDFWRKLPNCRFKHSVIVQCELGISRLLEGEGFGLAAFCEYDKMPQDLGEGSPRGGWPGAPVNATHWGWQSLVTKYGCPFIKVQLLRDNPKGDADVNEWEAVIRAVSDYDVALIRRHLERMAGRS